MRLAEQILSQISYLNSWFQSMTVLNAVSRNELSLIFSHIDGEKTYLCGSTIYCWLELTAADSGTNYIYHRCNSYFFGSVFMQIAMSEPLSVVRILGMHGTWMLLL